MDDPINDPICQAPPRESEQPLLPELEPAIRAYETSAASAAAPAAQASGVEPRVAVESPWKRAGREVLSGIQTLFSAAVYATLIVTFGFQVARVDGLSMAPTLEDHDRLIVDKLVYELGDPRPGDIVMLYYPVN